LTRAVARLTIAACRRKKMRWFVVLVFGALLAIFLWILAGTFAYSKDKQESIEKDIFMKLCKPHPVLVCT